MNQIKELHKANPLLILERIDGFPSIQFYQYKSKNYVSYIAKETDNEISFIYTEVSMDDFNRLKMREIDLYGVVKDKISFELVCSIKKGSYCNLIEKNNILRINEIILNNEEILPCKNIYLNFFQ
jgi:hypothetical protein